MSHRKGEKQEPPFHVVHKLPHGDSPYVRAKHVQVHIHMRIMHIYLHYIGPDDIVLSDLFSCFRLNYKSQDFYMFDSFSEFMTRFFVGK